MSMPRLFTFRLMAFLCVASSALGLNPKHLISQYGHHAWRLQEGFFSGSPTAMTQDADGYLWIGTEAGLVRFDGVRFVSWNDLSAKVAPFSSVYALLGARDGSLWIGTGAGLYRWKNAALTSYPEPRGRITSLVEDKDGAVWLSRSRVPDTKGGVCRVSDKATRCYGEADGNPFRFASVLIRDDAENFWIGSSLGLCRWKPGSGSKYLRNELKRSEGVPGVQAIVRLADGSLWVGMEPSGTGLGLQQLIQGVWKGEALSGMRSTDLNVVALQMDRDGALWIGTASKGLYRLHERRVDHFQSSDGLSSDSLESLYEDREGVVWAITSRGIDSFYDVRVATISMREGLSGDNAHSVLAAPDGSIWIGTAGSLDVLRDQKLAGIGAREGLPGRMVTALLRDRAGRLWMGIDNDLAVYEGGRFRKIKAPDGSPVGIVVSLVEEEGGDIWAATTSVTRALIRLRDGKVIEEVDTSRIVKGSTLAADPQGGIWIGFNRGEVGHYRNGQLETFSLTATPGVMKIRNLFVDSDAGLWMATTKGMFLRKSKEVKTLNSRNGLPCDEMFAAIKDDSGAIWLYATCGLFSITEAELKKWWGHPDNGVQFKTFDTFDGAQPGLSSFKPMAARSPDGRLWFANASVLQSIDPGDLHWNSTPPPVHVERIVVDHKSYLPGDNLRLPPLPRDLEIEYTALSFAMPRKVRFRYRLEGHESDWQDPETRRQAFYSDLAPGDYKFHVIACNNDGVWNQAGATWSFSVTPAYYQTTWFRFLAAGFGIVSVWGLYRLRVRQIAAGINSRFDERLEERTRLARELHDTLLQTIQGSKLVAEDALDTPENSDRMRSAMEQLAQWLGHAMTEGRAALNSLRTSTTQGNDLARAFQAAALQCGLTESMEFALTVTGTSKEMHPIVRDEVYRIGYEAIRNACTHSHGSRVEVDLIYARDLSMRIRDDGKGIAPDIVANGRHGHFGLQGMQERAARVGGKLRVFSSATSGTEVELLVPGSIVFHDKSHGWVAAVKRFLPLGARKSETD